MSDVLIDLARRELHVGDEVLPVTHWADEDGDDCEPEDAVALVAGPTATGHWLSVQIGDVVEGPTFH